MMTSQLAMYDTLNDRDDVIPCLQEQLVGAGIRNLQTMKS